MPRKALEDWRSQPQTVAGRWVYTNLQSLHTSIYNPYNVSICWHRRTHPGPKLPVTNFKISNYSMRALKCNAQIIYNNPLTGQCTRELDRFAVTDSEHRQAIQCRSPLIVHVYSWILDECTCCNWRFTFVCFFLVESLGSLENVQHLQQPASPDGLSEAQVSQLQRRTRLRQKAGLNLWDVSH